MVMDSDHRPGEFSRRVDLRGADHDQHTFVLFDAQAVGTKDLFELSSGRSFRGLVQNSHLGRDHSIRKEQGEAGLLQAEKGCFERAADPRLRGSKALGSRRDGDQEQGAHQRRTEGQTVGAGLGSEGLSRFLHPKKYSSPPLPVFG
jgi:hypothetical protein